MTNLPNLPLDNNTNFVTGDFVVLTPEAGTDVLLEIIEHKYTSDTYRVRNVLTGSCGPIHKNQIRYATKAEVKAKRRSPEPVELFISSIREIPFRMYPPPATAILDMGDVTNISKHVSPLCRVINKTYMTDVIDHLVRAHKAHQEIS
ncbi:hypothetical protein F900_01901 [Acinetobacter modestus]|uniref:Uncharacterized protein n=1 Tax=Acinetobacter modestus TaxID=1776740 RepID=N9NDL0_9GAMM|nr:hypothetical protein [Acinetobacter modestus]ENX00917.1 hypothetical protein F900_01901 [Acinetobacter modestus]